MEIIGLLLTLRRDIWGKGRPRAKRGVKYIKGLVMGGRRERVPMVSPNQLEKCQLKKSWKFEQGSLCHEHCTWCIQWRDKPTTLLYPHPTLFSPLDSMVCDFFSFFFTSNLNIKFLESSSVFWKSTKLTLLYLFVYLVVVVVLSRQLRCIYEDID